MQTRTPHHPISNPHTRAALKRFQNAIHTRTGTQTPDVRKAFESFVRSLGFILLLHLPIFFLFTCVYTIYAFNITQTPEKTTTFYTLWYISLTLSGLISLARSRRRPPPTLQDLQTRDHQLQLLSHIYPYVHTLQNDTPFRSLLQPHNTDSNTKTLAYIPFNTRSGPITARLSTTSKTLSLQLLLPPSTSSRLARQPHWTQTLTHNAPSAANLRIEHRKGLHQVTLIAKRPDCLEIAQERALPSLSERLQSPNFGLTPPPSSNVLQNPDSMLAILDAFHQLMALLRVPVLHNTHTDTTPTLSNHLTLHPNPPTPSSQSLTLPASFSSVLIDPWNVPPFSQLPTPTTSPITTLSLSSLLALGSCITTAILIHIVSPPSVPLSLQLATWGILATFAAWRTQWLPTQQPLLWPRKASQELLLQRQGEVLRIVRTHGDHNPAHNTVMTRVDLSRPFFIDATITPNPPSSTRVSSGTSLLHIELRQTLPHGDPQRLNITIPIQATQEASDTLTHLHKHGHLCDPHDFFTFLWPWIHTRAAAHNTAIDFNIQNLHHTHAEAAQHHTVQHYATQPA